MRTTDSWGMCRSFFSRTHVGRVREKNEDRIFCPPAREPAGGLDVFAVCDGMGGESYGEVAAQIAVDTIARFAAQIEQTDGDRLSDAVSDCIRAANFAICQKRRELSASIGTTFALVRVQDGRLDAFNVGDSRIYLLCDDALKQLSEDHTVLQSRTNMGIKTEGKDIKRFGSQLTQHLGIFEEDMTIQAHHVRAVLKDSDTILLCSDGLTDMVSDDAIRDILMKHAGDEAADLLIDAALRGGGVDNVSLVLIRVAETTDLKVV